MKFLLLTLIFSISLVTNEVWAGKSEPEFEKFEIASGGGFTGFVQGYKVKSNGNLYRCEGIGNCSKDSLVKKLSKREMNKLKKILKKANLFKYKLQEPGNTWHSMSMTNRGTTHTIIWNPYSSSKTVEFLNKVYTEINSLFNK
ncbi:hypothetical protein D9V84_02555 [Bacteroidetes/Chlorobi group bacterium Naka2016]|jgi:hypothetical protein|nr:MAG: hypothetical protein D9V84_02555 [Bacteroidetes/Chlorobi group bacterium Naka2016]